jgi:AcrR family transcriptional regulator
VSSATSTRLTKTDRRLQLLDVAVELVLDQGPAAVTMERLAERAGVSKALVYLHFGNADDVLAAVYRREIDQLGAAILAAVDAAGTPEEQLRAAIDAYFDVVQRRGGVFTVMTTAGAARRATADTDPRLGSRFVAGLYQRIFDLPPRRAKLAAAMLMGALNGGVEAWGAGELRRHEVGDAAFSIALLLAGRE